MKAKATIVLSTIAVTVAALLALTWFVGLAGAGPLARPSSQGGAPPVVSYQGQVTVDGSPYDGSGYFKFAVVDSPCSALYWSNDGSGSCSTDPSASVPLTVTRGLFNVLLGNTALEGMSQPLSASVFTGTERYLRVWFSDDDVTFQQLSPDRRVAAVPYALQAEEARDADTVDGQHAGDLEIPSGAMVLSTAPNETTLIAAGFSYTGGTLGDTWDTRATMPTGRAYLAAAMVDGIVYAIGGQSSGTSYETANEAYDPVTDSWSTRAAMPTGRRYLAAVAVDGVIFAIGGDNGGVPLTHTEAYHPISNTWTTRAPIPTGRMLLAATAVDGVVYAVGGLSLATTYETANEAYYPISDTWVSGAPMPTGRRTLAAASANGVVYAVGGQSSGFPTAAPTNEAYYPISDTWVSRAPMPTGRGNLAAAAVDGIIYAIGGNPGPLTATQAYDPSADSWSTRAPMPTARACLAAATSGSGAIYAIGGDTTSNWMLNEVYLPPLYIYRKD